MTSPGMDPNSDISAGTASGDAVNAMQQALAAEHAAVWSYGLASAFAGTGYAKDVSDGATSHRAQRDACATIVRQSGAAPVATQPGYQTPQPVTDAQSALRLLAVSEADCCSAWRGVLVRTDDAALRGTALDALTYSAVKATHWRQITNQVPSASALPGMR